jgi:hypothetical protein
VIRILRAKTSKTVTDLSKHYESTHTKATGKRYRTTIGTPTLAEHIKLHIHALRGLLEELVSLAGEDQAIGEGIHGFLDEVLLETGRLVESSKKALATTKAARQKPELEIAIVRGSHAPFEQTKSPARSQFWSFHKRATPDAERRVSSAEGESDFEIVDDDTQSGPGR